MNKIYFLREFVNTLERLDSVEQRWVDKVVDQLQSNLKVGKTLRYSWFREKKLGNKRLYFFINEETGKALVVVFARKKEQDKAVENFLKHNKDYLRLIEP